MKKTIILFAIIAGFGAIGAHAATPVHGKSPIKKNAPTTHPFNCTIALSGSLSVGFGTITATCSATEGTCDLAQASASACLSSVLRSLRAYLK